MKAYCKKGLALILAVVMAVGLFPSAAFAADEPGDAYMKIYHLDCGRKYFSVPQIKDLLDTLSANDYNYMELAIGNNGLRFLLDDMSVAANGKSYADDDVTEAIRSGNANYTMASSGELSESQMNDILAYAEEKGVAIIPLLNSPGHMNALLDAVESLDGVTYAYNGSGSTVDVTNDAAVAFTQAIISKYVDYFASKGCEYFNLGADEYANDVYTSGGMGFGHLVSKGKYQAYVNYINGVAAIIKDAGMTPMAFNDGIYYGDTTAYPIDTDILICYWTSGWSGYTLRSAANLSKDGFDIINTNDGWYYVLGRHTGTYGLDSAQNGVQNKAYDEIPGNNGSVTPVGSMMCLWCDTPSAAYNNTEVGYVEDLITTFAENNTEVFNLNDDDDGDDNQGGDPEDGEEDTSVEGLPEKYTGEVEADLGSGDPIYVLDTDGVDVGSKYLIVMRDRAKMLTCNAYGNYYVYCSAADVTISQTDGQTVAAADEPTLWTFNDESDAVISSDSGYYLDPSNQSFASSNAKTSLVEHEGGGQYAISAEDSFGYTRYLSNNGDNFARSTTSSTVRLFKESDPPAAGYIVELDGIDALIADTENLYENGAANGYSEELWNAFVEAYEAAEAAAADTEDGYDDRADATAQQIAVNVTAHALYTAWQALKAESVVLTVNYICGETVFDSDEYFYADGTSVTVTAKSFADYTLLGSDTRTVAMNGDQSINFYYEVNVSGADSVYAQYLCTSLKIEGSDGDYGKDITAEELLVPQYVSNLAPAYGTSGGMTYYFWKARVIDRAETDGGQLDDGSGDNECITTEGAWDIDALMYQDGDYWFRETGSSEWTRLDYTEDGSTGHQLVFYYQCRYAESEGFGAVYSSDWGYDRAQDRSVYEVQMSIYLLNGEESTLVSTDSTWLANGIRVLLVGVEPQYKIVRTELKYYEGEQNVPTSGTPDEEITHYGQIPDSPSLPSSKDGAYAVAYYIREKATLSVTYEWLNYPSSATLPVDEEEYRPGDTVTVDTTCAKGATMVDGAYLYTFSGWHTDNALKNAAGETFAIAGDTVLYGNWTRELNESITVTANSASKVYDGTPLSDAGFTVTYIGRTVNPNGEGRYVIGGESIAILPVIEGTKTNVGTVTNRITDISITGEGDTEYNVITVDGTLTVTPKLVVTYYQEGSADMLAAESLTEIVVPGDRLVLSEDQLNAKQPEGYLSGVQQEAPYLVTDSNEQSVVVFYPAKPVSVTVSKVWDDGDNRDNKRPASVSIQLTANGEADGDPITLSAANGWIYTWRDKPVYADNTAIVYGVVELSVPDNYSYVVKGSAEDGFTVTNSYPAKCNVSYRYEGEVPDGAPAAPETESYEFGSTVTVAAAPTLTGYTFSGWIHDGTVVTGEFSISGHVALVGSWTVNEYAYTVNYYMDSAEGIPFKTEYGTADFGAAIPYGSYAPAGYDATGKISGQTTVTADDNANVLNVVYEALPTYQVEYSWNLPADTVFYDATGNKVYPTLPDGYTGLYHGQTYSVDSIWADGTEIFAHDKYNNAIGKYTFNGWVDPGKGVMGDENIVIMGRWAYQAITVPAHRVIYVFEGNVPAGYEAPVDENTYVKGESYTVADGYTAVETKDAYGNVNGRYTFTGWADPNNGTMGDADVTVTGTWVYAPVTVPAHRVTYVFEGNVPAGYEAPVDENTYVKGESYTVADGYTAVETKDAYGNVNGRYTFTGWADPNNGTMGDADVTVTGTWVYAPVTVPSHRVTYVFEGNVPAGYEAPVDENTYVKGEAYTVAGGYEAVETKDAYGNVNGRYTFTGWADPNNGTMGDADVTVTGTWVYETVTVPTNRVIYVFEGSVPAGYEAPVDENTYVKGETYTVAGGYEAVETKDAYGNVNGRYTFTGWADPNNGTMGDEDVTIAGTWVYAPVTVPSHRVTYVFSGDVPAGYDVPVDENTYVKGENYTVADGYTAVETKDAYGNVNGRYTFTGWADPNNGTMGDADVTVTGTWVYEAIPVEPETPPVAPKTGTVVLTKVDAADENTTLENVVFELYRAGGILEGIYVTGADGTITVEDLSAGKYYWLEVRPAEGYLLDTSRHSFTVFDNRTTRLTVTNTRTAIPEAFSGDHYAYVIGYADGLVRPEANITRAQVATIFFRLLTDEVREQYLTKENAFADVSADMWYNTAVSTMAAMGIINGYPDGNFHPNANITRAEFAAIAARFDTNSNSTGSASFADIYGHWAQKEIDAAYQNGWILGYTDGTFRPDQSITRAEAMTMINRVLQRVPENENDLLEDMVVWPDNMDIQRWYYLAVQEATNSHDYQRKESGYEYWTNLKEIRDWSVFER